MQATALSKKTDYRKYVKTIEKFIVLAAWIAIYVGLYAVTKDSAVTHHTKAHSVDGMGLHPPFGIQAQENNFMKNGKDTNHAR